MSVDAEEVPLSNKTILFADDSATMRIAMERTFAAEPFDVVTVPTGEAAISKAREMQPSIIVADSNLAAGISGYDVCRKIREDSLLAGTPLLLLSGVSDPFDDALGKKVGIDAHMKKPFDTTQMIEKVNSLTSVSKVVETPGPAPAKDDKDTSHKATAPVPKAGAQPRPKADEPIPLTKRPVAKDKSIKEPVVSSPTIRHAVPVQQPKETMEFGRATSAKVAQIKPTVLSGPGDAPAPQGEEVSLDDDDLVPIETEEKPTDDGVESFQVGTLAELAQMDGKGTPRKPDLGEDAIELPKKKPEKPAMDLERLEPPSKKGPSAAAANQVASAVSAIAGRVEGVTPEQIEAIRQLTNEIVEQVVWEVVPDLAEAIIKEELAKLLKE